MKIIVGLGNPDTTYLFTRHNLGFMLIDTLAKGSKFQSKHKSHIQKIELEGENILLAKPQTFMNLSGQAIREIISFYKAPLEDLLVIQDDKDQTFGKMKFQKSRGHGGHNGIKNIHQELNSQDYCRLKIGVASILSTDKEADLDIDLKPMQDNTTQFIPSPKIGGTVYPAPMQNTAQFILSPFDQTEKQKLPDLLEQGFKAVSHFVQKGYESAANQFNSKGLDD